MKQLTPEEDERVAVLIAALAPFADECNRVHVERFTAMCAELEGLLERRQATVGVPKIRIEAHGVVTNPS